MFLAFVGAALVASIDESRLKPLLQTIIKNSASQCLCGKFIY